MNNGALVALGIASLTASLAGTSLAAGTSGTLTVVADGFRNGQGHAFARLYRPGDKVTAAPWRLVRADITGNQARFEFPDLPFGDYAVVVHHDENDNGKIDHGVLGLPAEPLGFSNGFELGVFSGAPTFEKLRVAFGERSSPLRLTVR
jgi:uncharacterized protein (DUF2141 family)